MLGMFAQNASLPGPADDLFVFSNSARGINESEIVVLSISVVAASMACNLNLAAQFS